MKLWDNETMKPSFTLTLDTTAPPTRVWDALTRSELVEQYMFGARVETDWQPGSSVEFFVDRDGQSVRMVHGRVVEADPPQRLVHTLFPSTWKMKDTPANYLQVAYDIEATPGGSRLTITQSGFDTAAESERRYHDSVKAWDVTLPKLKAVIEGE